jgi:hypothetical protein
MADTSASATNEWLQPNNRPEIIDTLINGVGEPFSFIQKKISGS